MAAPTTMVTEEVAKTRFCIVRPDQQCCTTQCMAWRFGPSKWMQEPKAGQTIDFLPNGGKGPVYFDSERETYLATYTNKWAEAKEIVLGYCGVAGEAK